MTAITAEALFKQIEEYDPPTSRRESLAMAEPYLFAPVSEAKSEIHGNGDYLIEELTDADLDAPLDIV